MIAGLNRTARRNGIFVSAFIFIVIAGWMFGVWNAFQGETTALRSVIICSPAVLWAAYLAVRTLRLLRRGQPALFVADGKLHADQLLNFWSVPLKDIRSVERIEIATTFARHPYLRVHLASGGSRDISPKFLDVPEDEIVRRINALRPIWSELSSPAAP